MLEPLFPLGDWRWGLIAIAGFVGLWWTVKRASPRQSAFSASEELQKAKIEARRERWRQHGDGILAVSILAGFMISVIVLVGIVLVFGEKP